MLAFENGNDISLIPGEILNFKITEKRFKKSLKLFNSNMNESFIRTGSGFDVHKFTDGNNIVLLGIKIPLENHWTDIQTQT